MSNQDIHTARAYHEATKLSYINLHNKPPLYKSYAGLPVVPLPTDFSPPEMPALDAVAAIAHEGSPSLDLASVARLLFFSAGLIRKGAFSGAGEVHFRAAASAGALYPVEVYLVCEDIPGLEAGVYHFSPLDFSLSQLRKGDYRGELSSAAGASESVSTSPATLIFTAIFWRSAWKYRVRSYRYCFWDNGTVLANLLATASADGLPTQVVAGFVDERVNRLLGIHAEREASLCLVPVGEKGVSQPPSERLADPPDLERLDGDGLATASDEIEYPEIRQAHRVSSLATEEEAAAWRGVAASISSLPSESGGPVYTLQPLEEDSEASEALGKAILERGSTRRFAPESISLPHLSAILGCSTGGVPADFLGPGGESLVDIYMIANAVGGLPAGSYFFSRWQRGLEQLEAGPFRAEAGHLCFEQALGADASAVMFFMADLERVLGRYGSRGYRAAQLEAGILGGRMYLCAHSLGLGASGLTFYDDDVTDFFSPHAAGKSVCFVVAVGVTSETNRVRPFRSRVGVVLDALSRGAVKREG